MTKPSYDAEILELASYLLHAPEPPASTIDNARYNLIDSLSCMLMALKFPAAQRHLGPMPGLANVQGGTKVPGTSYQLDPVKATWDIGALVRWLDFNDTWLAAEWGHPSDNWASVLGVGDYLSRNPDLIGGRELLVSDLLKTIVKAHEIQGVLALENSFNRVGLDHVLLVKLASCGVSALMLGLNEEQIAACLSHALIDGQALRCYRHAPNTMARKSWAAGDAASRGVRLAFMVKKGEQGIPKALSAKTWGFYDVLFKGKAFSFQRGYGHYIMDQILYKISYPAEFHAQTAVECAIKLHDQVRGRFDEIDRIALDTQEPAMRIISKQGPLHNPADRDHCLEYMVAVGLMLGELKAEHYEDRFATANPLIDDLRSKMSASEDEDYTKSYYDPDKRAIPNAIQIFFKDGSSSEKVRVDYPIGHPMRRAEGIPLLLDKFDKALKAHYSDDQAQRIKALLSDHDALCKTKVSTLSDLLAM